MEGETFLWLIRHAPVDGVKGTIHAADAPADLGDRAQRRGCPSRSRRGRTAALFRERAFRPDRQGFVDPAHQPGPESGRRRNIADEDQGLLGAEQDRIGLTQTPPADDGERVASDEGFAAYSWGAAAALGTMSPHRIPFSSPLGETVKTI